MIEALGFKRLLILIVLGGAVAVLAFFNFMVFAPQAAATKAALNKANGENSTLTADIESMKNGMAKFQTEKVLFDQINKIGVFNEQNRVVARERFNVMQKLSKVMAAKYEIKPATLVESGLTSVDGTTDDTYAILRSPISVSLSALDDLDIYRFVYYLNYSFPGQVTIKNLHIERNDKVSPSTLKEIGGGEPPELISSRMDLDWNTIVNRNNVPAAKSDGVSADDVPATGAGVDRP